MPKAIQFTLAHENLPGMLAHIANVLGDAQLNILAFSPLRPVERGKLI